MGVTSYLTVNGEILSETRNVVESDYVPDPLGSTAALIGSTQTITDTFAWWPYGELRNHVGSSVTPFGYGGTLGRYTDFASGRKDMRAGIYRRTLARWQTVDMLWPNALPYSYALASPVAWVDPEGSVPRRACTETCPKGWQVAHVTCYEFGAAHHPNASNPVSYGHLPACGGCDRNPRSSGCAVGNRKGEDRRVVCKPGLNVTIAFPGTNPPQVKAKCRVSDGGQGHSGIDVYYPVPDTNCGSHFTARKYCFKCS